ncbi:Protein of unknown function DUF2343 protein [Actinidia chinensis var. chinensis]|uniref:Uncharacterized protein n=1 Tax=Actinidia chinensis var. chinensis TaxID=1590841 RepID=A0A2R6PU20_ACTCC|nr:Protein of unknown function DUF2343 protein [Actinidia chinensis var. chinensis]
MFNKSKQKHSGCLIINQIMRARLVVFPIRGRNWCFTRSIDRSASESQSSQTPSTFKELWNNIFNSNDKPTESNAELLIDFASNKMNRAWTGLEKAPPGSFKSKLHGLGLRLLARVKPSEIFLKSISKDVTKVEITYPSSLIARHVRRRLRHIALRGTVIHKRYFYGSVSLLPLTTAFTVLPLPNIPFFWILFRTYSHWRALKGSERLLQLVSDSSASQNSSVAIVTKNNSHGDSEDVMRNPSSPWVGVLQPSEELEKLVQHGDADHGLSKCILSDICKTFDLNTMDVVKYRDSV